MPRPTRASPRRAGLPGPQLRRCAGGLAAGVSAAVVLTAGFAPGAGAAPAQVPRWPTDAAWQRYVEAPASSDVEPVRVVSTSGAVSGATALVRGGAQHGDVTLTMAAGGPAPDVVVDYGKDVGGVPYFVVGSATGAPSLHSSFSEGFQYLGPGGDGGPAMSSAGDPSRADDLTAASPGVLTTGLIQGGERYEEIALSTPGTVTLSSVGIRFSAALAPARSYRGWFDSSSEQLNRIFYDGAYTTQLDELPAGTLRAPWHIAGGALEADGGNGGLLRRGARWTDYTVSFDAKVVEGQAGWLVRARSSSSGYLFFLDDATDTQGTPDTLSEIAFGPSEYTTIADVALPAPIGAGSWHHVSTVVAGPIVSTSIDGRPVARFDTGSLPAGASVYDSGTVGFLVPGTQASYRDLRVTAPDGATLYANSLARSSALAGFTGPELSSPDGLPVIMDGAKRDRVVWSGDLGVEGPTVFDTTAADDYIRGSLKLLGSYQELSGESGADVPPTVPLGTFPASGYPYSTSYSMDEVDNIATYYLYTGDLGFVRSEWPMITRELAYDRSLVDARGLLVTDESDGMDWDYYDGSKTGEVTAFNDIYYETLLDAATMAAALNLGAPTATYRQEAASLRSAINRYLFDPATDLYPVSNLQPGTVAQDADSMAVLFGVAPSGKGAAILDAMGRALPTTPYGTLPFSANTGYEEAVSPFVTNEELQALFGEGDTAPAMSMLETLWGYMDGPGPDFTGADWEGVGADGSPDFEGFTSLAHGWSTGPTADLSAYVVGVQPSSAGYRTWTVRPSPGSLAWVEGDVPTPQGTIAVRWAQGRPSGRFAMEVSAPPGTRGTISVPVPATGASVTVRTTGPSPVGPTTRSIVAPTGATTVSVQAVGGRTYHLVVVPR
ncbi:MAG: alpha-L-rhamnosidase C-terminal domain-containing protein [Acidimicrobiales bacterium]